MTALLTRPPLASPSARSFTLKPYLWTCEEFHTLGDAGILEGRTVILIDGEILAMPNPNPPHDSVVGIVDYLLKDRFRPGYWVRVQSGLPTALDTDPVPDLAVVVGSPRDYPNSYPSNAVLIVEVSDTSLSYDIGEKSNLYAAAGILDYWVIDVNTPQLFVFRDPLADPAAPRGFRYATIQTLTAGATIAPLALPNVSIAVSELLP